MTDRRIDATLNTQLIDLSTHEALPMTNSTRSASAVAKQVALCLLAAALLMDIGCVSRRAYVQLKAEIQEQTQSLKTGQEDVRG